MFGLKLNLKNTEKSVKQRAEGFGQRILQQLFGLTLNWEKQRDIIKNNYELGLKHFRLGNIKDAIFRLRLVTWLDPKHADGWYYLGRSYLAESKPALALAALHKAQVLRPDHEETLYMLAIAGGTQTPAGQLPLKIPMSLSLEHFEGVAAGFTKEQMEAFGYQGPMLLDKAIRTCITPGRVDHVILELGVGTGLCGFLLRNITSEMVGVDISGNMLDMAMKLQDANGKKIYDALVKGDLQEFLKSSAPAQYDIVLAGGVLSYIGDLHALFTLVAHTLKKGGLFVFTADILAGEGFRLDTEAGRFRYSQTYLSNLAQSAGLTGIIFDEAEVYPNYKMWLCVLKK